MSAESGVVTMPDTKRDIAGAIERAKLASPLACPTSLGWKAWVKDLQILGNQLEQSQEEVARLAAQEEMDDLLRDGCMDKLLETEAALEQSQREVEELKTGTRQLADSAARENAHLRLIHQKVACPYGHGSAESGCALGYPGCACMDDVLAMMAWGPEDEDKAAVRLGQRLKASQARVAELTAEVEEQAAVIQAMEQVTVGPLSYTAMRAERDASQALVARLRGALEFYADPGTYHACAFMFDRPTGGFDEDFEQEHGDPDYDRPMPGKRARQALQEGE